MVVEQRRDEFDSRMCNSVFVDETSAQSGCMEDIHFSTNDIMPIISGTTETWAKRVEERYQGVTNHLEHHCLKVDLIEHLWERRGHE